MIYQVLGTPRGPSNTEEEGDIVDLDEVKPDDPINAFEQVGWMPDPRRLNTDAQSLMDDEGWVGAQ